MPDRQFPATCKRSPRLGKRPGYRPSRSQKRCSETMTRQEVISDLTQDGYQPFMRPFTGSVIMAEAWASRAKDKRLVIILYRSDTGEMVDLHDLPEDEENRPDVEAFIDDFRENVFRPAPELPKH